MADAPRSWSREQVQEILRRAGERADAEDGIRHEELIAAAKEAGLDPDSVEAAAKELAHGESDRQALERITGTEIRRRRIRFQRSTLTWGVASALSGLAWLLLGTAGGAIWPFAIPVLLFGTFAGLAGVRAFSPPDPDQMERRLRHEKRDHEREEARRKRREEAEAWSKKLQDEIAQRRSRSDARRAKAMEMEDAVEAGVQAVLGSLARAVKSAIERPPSGGPGGDFGRYVDRQKYGTPPARPMRVDVVDHGPSRVRVAADESTDREAKADAPARARKRAER